MDRRTFNKLRAIVYEAAGIAIGERKEAMVSARVAKRMRALGIGTHREYLRYLMEDQTRDEIVSLLDVITVNVTSFFREPNHFDFLGRVVSEWLARGQRRFRFWSTAASTGEEPYSMAMTLSEAARGYNADMRILATDISTRVLAQCQGGTYDLDKVKTVFPTLRQRYFDVYRANGTVTCTAKPALKNMIVFRRLNLSTPPFPMRGPLDVIFCRNVMIYFDNKVRKALLAEMYRLLKPQGYLIVGSAESLTGIISDFKCVKPSIHVKA